MDRLSEIKWLIPELKINALNIRNETRPLSNRSRLHYVIKKEMIDVAKKVIQDCDMHTLEGYETRKLLHKSFMYMMELLFVNNPRLEKICSKKSSELVFSCFTKYVFCRKSLNENLDDLEYVLKFWGYNLTYVEVSGYPFDSQVMQLINTNCPPGLKGLGMDILEMSDFENVCFNMHKIEKLKVEWRCEKSTLPMTLVKSLEELGKTLKQFDLSCHSKGGVFLLDSLVSVFPRFIALERLYLDGFPLNQTVIQTISEITSITELLLFQPHGHPIMEIEKINLSSIGNLKNLKKLDISWGCITDETLIKLGDDAKNLEELHILGTKITDNGIFAVTKMSQLQKLSLGLDRFHQKIVGKQNKYITDKSIECLFNEKLKYLDLSGCRKVSNRSVIKLFENLPDISYLYVQNTNVTIKVVEELSKLTKIYEEQVEVFVSFKDFKGIFKSLLESHNIKFITPRLLIF